MQFLSGVDSEQTGIGRSHLVISFK
jgi:hypothetical protein